MIKINPFFNWSKEEFRVELTGQGLPVHPLVASGYRSIGCQPCTSPVKENEDEREGRWRHTLGVGGQKTECGLHVQLKDK